MERRGVSRALLIAAVIVVIVAIALAAFFMAREEAKPEKITVLARSGTYAEGLKIAAAQFEAETGIRVEVQELGYKELYDKLSTEALQKTGAFDVVMLDDPWLAGFASQGFLEDIGRMLEERGLTVDPDFIDSAIEVSKYKGTLYALPYAGNVQLFVYRTDLYSKYGFSKPTTWNDVLEAAKKIYEEEGIYGYVIRGKKGNPVVTNFLPIFWAHGAKIVDENGNVMVDSPQAIAALKLFIELKKYSPPGTESFDSAEVKASIFEGRVAASIIWPAWVPDINDPSKSKAAGNVEVIPPPGAAPMIGAWLLAIPVSSKNKDTALDFILFVLSKDMQKKIALEAGVPPTRESLYTDPDVVAKYSWYPTQLEALKNSQMRPRVPEWSQIEDILANYIHQALIGAMSPEEALSKAKQEIEAVVKG
ncbi:MAG: ABC transporter substrate-binding protein [Desulfurococcales archaeon]|nr:ABC transporter substrate-binding protein [Desulfurococcales archaeon]